MSSRHLNTGHGQEAVSGHHSIPRARTGIASVSQRRLPHSYGSHPIRHHTMTTARNGTATCLHQTVDAISSIGLPDIDSAAEWFLRVARRGGTVHLAGNGGAAALASHAAADFAMPRSFEATGVRVVAAFDGAARFSMLANDCGWNDALSGYVHSLMSKEDGLVLITSSGSPGRSGNLVAGARTAQTLGIDTISLMPQDSGPLHEACDWAVCCPGYPVSSEVFEVLSLLVIHLVRLRCEERPSLD